MAIVKKSQSDIELEKALKIAQGIPASQVVVNPFTETNKRTPIQANVVKGANPGGTKTRAEAMAPLIASAATGGRPASTIYTPGQNQKEQQNAERDARIAIETGKPVSTPRLSAVQQVEQQNNAVVDKFTTERKAQRDNVIKGIVEQAKQTDPEIQKLLTERQGLVNKGIWGQTGGERVWEQNYSAALQRVVDSSPEIQAFDQATPSEQQKAVDALGPAAGRVRNIATGSAGYTPEERVAAFLGLPEGQTIQFIDGRFEIVATDDIGFEPDPHLRAEKRLERKRQEGLQDINAQYDPAIRQLEGQTLLNGKTPTQLQKNIDKLKRDKQRAVERLDANVGDLKEDVIVQEQARQSEIMRGINEANSPDKLIEKQKAEALLSRINEKIQSGQASDYLQAEALVKNDIAKETDVGAQDFQSFRAYLGTPQGQSSSPMAMFAEARRIKQGNNDEANKLLAATVDQQFADDAQDSWLESRGIQNPEERARSRQRRQLDAFKNIILDGGGDKNGNDVSDMILQYGKLDPTGFLQEEFLKNVQASPNTNYREKTIAGMGLEELANSRLQKGVKYEYKQDEFGTPFLFNPFTKEMEPVGRATAVYGGTQISNPITPSRDLISLSDQNTLNGFGEQYRAGRLTQDDTTKLTAKFKDNPASAQAWGQILKDGPYIGTEKATLFDVDPKITEGELSRVIKARQEAGYGNIAFQGEKMKSYIDGFDGMKMIDDSITMQALLEGNNYLNGEEFQNLSEGQKRRTYSILVQGGVGSFDSDGQYIQDPQMDDILNTGAIRGFKVPFLSQLTPGSLKASEFWGDAPPSRDLLFDSLAGKYTADKMKDISGAAVSDLEVQRLIPTLPNTANEEERNIINNRANILALTKAADTTAGRYGFTSAEAMREAIRKGRSGDFKTVQGDSFSPSTSTPQEINSSLGSISASFEGGSPTSYNPDDGGTPSYGTWQMRGETAGGFATQLGFNNTDPSSPGFKEEWNSKVEQIGPEAFQQQEAIYIGKTHYQPQIEYLRQNNVPDVILENPVIQELIFSTSIQHGPRTDVILTALKNLANSGQPATVDSIVNAVIEERKTRFPSSTPKIRKSVQGRLDRERQSLISFK